MPIHVILTAMTALIERGRSRLREIDRLDDRGQATTEYALVLLGAALVGAAVVAWAAGGGASTIGGLFDRAIQSAMSQL